MKKVAVLFADGFEESESLTIVDILRRGGMECLMVGVTGREMMGVHDINVRADVELREISADDMDMVVPAIPVRRKRSRKVPLRKPLS